VKYLKPDPFRLGPFRLGRPDKTAKKELVASKLSRGWCIGDRAFKGEMRKAARERGADLDRFAGTEPEESRAERAWAGEESLQRLARSARLTLEQLPALEAHRDKALLAAVMKATTSVSNSWLSERLNMGEPASASQFARRLTLTPEGPAQVEVLQSRVKT